jgi:hypothetical protein
MDVIFGRFFVSFERGERNQQLHLQGVFTCQSQPNSQLAARRLNLLIKNQIPVQRSDNINVTVKPFADTQTRVGVLGYCQKDEGQAHYQSRRLNVTDQELVDGKAAYTAVRYSYLKELPPILNTNIMNLVYNFFCNEHPESFCNMSNIDLLAQVATQFNDRQARNAATARGNPRERPNEYRSVWTGVRDLPARQQAYVTWHRFGVYIRQLLQEMVGDVRGPIKMYQDNKTAKIMAEEVTTKRSNHVDNCLPLRSRVGTSGRGRRALLQHGGHVGGHDDEAGSSRHVGAATVHGYGGVLKYDVGT